MTERNKPSGLHLEHSILGVVAFSDSKERSHYVVLPLARITMQPFSDAAPWPKTRGHCTTSKGSRQPLWPGMLGA